MTAALKAITSIVLSFWISALACLAGCGQLLASSRAARHAHSAHIALLDMPGCHHSESSTPSEEKKQDSSTISCCLPDAIAQKTIAGLNLPVPRAVSHATAIDIADHSHSTAGNSPPANARGGREAILQTRLLRI